MVNEIKTIEDRKKSLIKKGTANGYVTYEEMAEELKGLEVDSDTLDDLYNTLVENHIEIISFNFLKSSSTSLSVQQELIFFLLHISAFVSP